MAYFDDPQKLAAWQRELAGLRERRERGGAATTSGPAQPQMEQQMDPMRTPTRTTGMGDLVREPITLEQLEVDAGVRSPGSLETSAQELARPEPQLSQR